MKKILFIMMSICTLFTACKIDDPGKDLKKRVVFDPGDLEFITNSLDPKQETMSALYGNQEAIQSLTNENNQPKPNSEFKLIT